VAVPWYAMVTAETRGEWLRTFFLKENLGRTAEPMENHRGPVVYYLIAVCAFFAPWSAFLYASIRSALIPLSPRGKGLGVRGTIFHLPSLRGGRREAAGGESASQGQGESPLPVPAAPTSPQRGEVFRTATVGRDTGAGIPSPDSPPSPLRPEEGGPESAGCFLPQLAMLLPHLASLTAQDNAPPPLLTGDHLTAAGLRPGPLFRKLLEATYDAQLEGHLSTPAQALSHALSLAPGPKSPP